VSQATVGAWLDIDTKRTLPDWFNMHRDLCIDWMRAHPKQIGGAGHIMQIDESAVVREGCSKWTCSTVPTEMGLQWHRQSNGLGFSVLSESTPVSGLI